VIAIFKVTTRSGEVRLYEGEATLLRALRSLKGRYTPRGPGYPKSVELIAATPMDVGPSYGVGVSE
jgi:hypothetical protein